MAETRAEKQTWREWAATALNEAAASPIEGETATRLYGMYETVAAVVIMYCEPGEDRQRALNELVGSYGTASGLVSPLEDT